jgi:hypothetical protein
VAEVAEVALGDIPANAASPFEAWQRRLRETFAAEAAAL